MDDAKLLIGVYEHGLGNWESIRSDPELGLSNKILPANKSMKPQSSHLQTRVDYLLKLLQEEAKRKTKVDWWILGDIIICIVHCGNACYGKGSSQECSMVVCRVNLLISHLIFC